MIRVARRTRIRTTVRRAFRDLPAPGSTDDPLHINAANRSPRVAELVRRIPKDGGSRKDAGLDFQLKCHRTCDGFRDVYGRMRWDDVAPTLTSGCINPSRGRYLHPSEDRAITLREAALLQTFPSTYRLSLSNGRYAAASLVGNALPPEFVRRHALAVVRHLTGTARRSPCATLNTKN